MLSTLYNIPVENLAFAFYNCKNLKTAPKLYENSENLIYVFTQCEALASVVILSKAVNLTNAFMDCKALTDVSEILSAVTEMTIMFDGCTALETAPTIPGSVTDVRSAFRNCTSLKGYVTINGSCNSTTKKNLAETSSAGNVK